MEKKKSLIKRIFCILGYVFLIITVAVGIGSIGYETYLYCKLNNGTISQSEKKYLDDQREMARLYWSN